jgi:hypothetical protein
MKKLKKDSIFRDMVRVALCNRSENGDFLRDNFNNNKSSINIKFSDFSFRREALIKKTALNYLNNIDKGI